MSISLTIEDQTGQVRVAPISDDHEPAPLTNTGQQFAALGIKEMQWHAGDRIVVHKDPDQKFIWAQLDESLTPDLLYIPGDEWVFSIPLKDQYYPSQLDSAFRTRRHYLCVRYADPWEIHAYRNWALNTHDQVTDSGAYPHASANVETRGEAVFFAKNAIDGKLANHSHGGYPFDSWGINSQDDAAIKVDFGRPVLIDRLRLLFRADFPHDNYWKKVSVRFSDGEVKSFSTTNSFEFQEFCFAPKQTQSVELFDLIKADHHSEWPALQQIEAYGFNTVQ
ncbi:discoidin domain-containing protein [Limosilactobacillus secaliphilus]|uniref:Carbohydrate-binding protein n=1 Tax=Limosilactobacillus secaliphilus TaxID=396268 RepID=A0A0R2HZZ3_9LACO|nr:discoidin domain-containing protein [Limosilactobacillus secaliphilus]KRN58448.1 hypothetical protein IV45_GL000895 [Limosilactobacillus secaliphilus]